MKPDALVATFWRRFAFATVLWIIAWPVIMFIRRGDISGPQAWFWIIGELNYPVVAVVYVLLDFLVKSCVSKSWIIFMIATTVIAALMPFYYSHYGFVLGVVLEAKFF